MSGLLKTLIKPDWDDSPKRSEILHAANLLQIGEFQLIQLAYKVWYREDLPEDKINKIYLIGKSANVIFQQLGSSIDCEIFDKLEDALKKIFLDNS